MKKEKSILERYDSDLKLKTEFRKAKIEFKKKMSEIIIPKNSDMNYGGKNYKYADIDAIQHSINPVLAECNLDLKFLVSPHPEKEMHETISVVVEHINGCFESNARIIKRIEKDQDYGKHLTYVKRYLVSALLALSSEEETDGRESEEYKSLKEFLSTKFPLKNSNQLDDIAAEVCRKRELYPTTIKNSDVNAIKQEWEKGEKEKKSPQVK